MEFNDLMKALAENAGVAEGFPPDEDGVVRVGQGDLVLAFMEIPERRALLVWSPIGLLPEEGADALKTDLLKANFMGRDVNGGALSLSDDGEAFLHQILQLDLLDKASFLRALEDFILVLARWTRTFAEYRPGESGAPEARESAEAGELDRSGFIRV